MRAFLNVAIAQRIPEQTMGHAIGGKVALTYEKEIGVQPSAAADPVDKRNSVR